MNKTLSQKIDEFVDKFEKRLNRRRFIEDLRIHGFEGSDSEILDQYYWLKAPRGSVSYEVPNEQESDELIDDEEVEEEEDDEDTPVKFGRW